MVCVSLAAGSGYALTFSVDQPPSGSVLNDGTLLEYNTQLGPVPDAIHQILVGTPVDALHIGAPCTGLLTGTDLGLRYREDQVPYYAWSNVAVVGTFLFSLDDGDPFPVGIAPDKLEEIRAAWPVAAPGEYATKTAQGYNMFLSLDTQTAIEPNLGLGQSGAFDDDIDALDTHGNPDVDPIFFSIDDRRTLIPNLPADIQTGDIWVRFADGGMAKAIDAVVDLGLVRDGDGPPPFFQENDDIDAFILVELDDNPENNFYREITYVDPTTGQQNVVVVDLGDGIFFSLDPEGDLPYQSAGVGPAQFRPSIPTEYIWFSSYGGFASLDNVISHAQLGLSMGPGDPDDIDALTCGQYIPEPGTLFLMGTAVVAMTGFLRRRRMK